MGYDLAYSISIARRFRGFWIHGSESQVGGVFLFYIRGLSELHRYRVGFRVKI